jgi:hypothetical protein
MFRLISDTDRFLSTNYGYLIFGTYSIFFLSSVTVEIWMAEFQLLGHGTG